MNPNQPNNFQSFTNQYKPNQYANYQFPNQQQFTQNTLNIPKNNFHQGGSLSPTESHQINRNKLDRAMYSSTIEGTLPSKSFGLGKLQSMGRFIGGNDQSRNESNKPSYQFSSSNGQHNNYGFQEQKQKTFEPFNSNNNPKCQFDRFPSFNLNDNHGQQQNIPNNNFRGQMNQPEQSQINSTETLTPQQKRRRQIMAIKQQLEMINKKMEHTNLNKKYTPQTQKNDFKSPINNNTTTTVNNNNYVNHTGSTSGSTSGSSSNSYGSSNFDNGLSFNKNNNLSVGQRNKGLVTQSMIVSNEPSTGFKYQSIFDKYDSMKKPTYQSSNTDVKEERSSLLDKFVHKGPGSELKKQPEGYSLSNPLGNLGSQNNKSSSYDFSSTSTTTKNNDPVSSYTSNYGSSNNSITSNNLNSAMTFGNTNYDQPKQGGGMFKKKKVAEEIKTQFATVTTQKTPENENGMMFKKSKPQFEDEDNIVTNAMKQMKIQESVDFKRQDFIVGKKLGKGQFGQVMLVQHKKTGFLCGMKVMEKKQIRDQKYEGQIARQLSIQFYLAHRNIAPLYGYFQDEKAVYLLVEYCTGGQLLELLRKNRRMQEPECSRIIKQIIEGIDYIHKELIIHRDIKPENILFNFGVAKICDFGWAVYKGHGMRKTASVGSPLYYSPEIVMGVQYDEKIDIWDIGMMTYECLLGKIPFRIYSELDLNRIVQDEIKFPQYIDTSDQAKDFILKIMKKKPEQRMQIREMLRHPFITKYQDVKLPIQIMKDFKQVLS